MDQPKTCLCAALLAGIDKASAGCLHVIPGWLFLELCIYLVSLLLMQELTEADDDNLTYHTNRISIA